MDSSRRKPPCFIEEEYDVEAGFSGNNHHPFVNRLTSLSSCYDRKSSLWNLSVSGFSSPRFCDARFEDLHHQPHFLEACSLCGKPLGDRDIFMYRGNTPFCSKECRQEQMNIDEAKEKNWNLSSSMKALRKKDPKKNSSSPTKTQVTVACDHCGQMAKTSPFDTKGSVVRLVSNAFPQLHHCGASLFATTSYHKFMV